MNLRNAPTREFDGLLFLSAIGLASFGAMLIYSGTLNTYGEPVPRVPTLSVNLLGLDADTVALILGLSVGSRITVTGLPSQAANTTEDYFIEGYAESIALDRYVLTFNVSPASPTLTTWLLEDATRGQLGTTTRLAY